MNSIVLQIQKAVTKILFLTLCAFFQVVFSAANSLLEYEEPMTLCTGSINFNTPIDADVCMHSICIYYKGNKIELDMNHDKKIKKIGQQGLKKDPIKMVPYILNEAKATKQLHVLICCAPQFSTEMNTVHYLFVPHGVTYKFYTLTAARQFSNGIEECTWKVDQENLSQDRIIPDNTIIFLFNAEYVEGLQPKSWPINSNARILPTIMIKKIMNTQEIMQAIMTARLAAIDFDPLHYRYPKHATKIESKTVVSIKL